MAIILRTFFWLSASLVMLLASACSEDTATPTPTTTSPAPINITGVQVTPGESLRVVGETSLPDDTCIQTQLYADHRLQSWWPSEQCALTQGGAWEISVPLQSEAYSIELSPDVEYQLIAFQQGSPAVESPIFVFDLSPPP